MSALLRSLSTQAPVVASPLDGSDAGSSGSGSMQAQLDSVQARLMALEARGGGLAASSPADVAPAASGSVSPEDCVALTCALSRWCSPFCFHQELCGVSGAPSVTDACPATAIRPRDASPRARNKIG